MHSRLGWAALGLAPVSNRARAAREPDSYFRRVAARAWALTSSPERDGYQGEEPLFPNPFPLPWCPLASQPLATAGPHANPR